MKRIALLAAAVAVAASVLACPPQTSRPVDAGQCTQLVLEGGAFDAGPNPGF